ncbi:hypothetical protein FHW69_001139 [Luteibacter sp. Sphag1AF]|uniref:hypothetical protein n=1 Tax=Luteibacter sp. Sphag1AF TaxID=2587031 RepID=UPI0016080D5E|nr:hypothetical protein [Luteibacter sp. Sphag1AF]MBB3226549.1 hypothetical protein [Luteibacter sp. Sphag1AF]
MTDTIDLLEAIGRDASLRHASVDDLTAALTNAQASEALTAAVAHGDPSLLCAELGHKPMVVPQISQSPGHEEEERQPDEENDSTESPAPDKLASSRVH